jgi:trimeric autotransporter adhesin
MTSIRGRRWLHALTRRSAGRLLVVGALTVPLGIVTLAAAPGAGAASSASTFTGAGEYTYTVPAGATAVAVTAVGGSGGTGLGGQSGGPGAVVSATVPVTSGTTLYVEVGGTGGNINTATTGAYNGGGTSGEGGWGGGASDIRLDPASTPLTTADTRLVVAGGGGGGGANAPGGDAGGAAGDPAASGAGNGGTGCEYDGCQTPGADAGLDNGTAGVGGSGSYEGTCDGLSGSLGEGGNGNLGCDADFFGGAGGGGYYGGGAGGDGYSAGGGGGAGSSYWTSAATDTSLAENTGGMPPEVVITPLIPTAPGPITPGTLPELVAGQQNSITFTSTGTPAPSFTETGNLPDQVTFTDNGNGTATLAGDPPPADGGLTYDFSVTASNGVAPDQVQDYSLTVAPSAPTAPTGVSATAGDGQATVSFSPPSTDGGSAITGYTVTATDTTNQANGGQTATGSGSPITVTGLTDGDTYTFTVTATNDVGNSPASDPSAPVTPAAPITVPGAPTQVSAVGGASQATVSFTPPASDGGSPISYYFVTATDSTNPANSQNGIGTSSPIVLTGLSDGDTYTFTVAAVNGVGTGPASAPSNPVVPDSVPQAPTSPYATAGNGQATVDFGPAFPYASPITSYTATATDLTNPANGGQTASGDSIELTVTGLTNGDTYTFTVTATNGVGTGPASVPTNAVIPAGPPEAPTAVSASPGNGQATVSFAAAPSNGSAVTGYLVIANDTTNAAYGSETATGTGSPITVTGLTNGNHYTFTVTATNAVGTGPASSPSPAVVPSTQLALPGAPTVVGVTAGNAKAAVSFTTPASNGGSRIVSYTVTATDDTNPANGGQTATGSAHTLTVTGLTNGDSYTFTVTATNGVGTGPASAPSNAAVPVSVPGPPTAVTATAGNGQATVSFTAPAADGGSPITGYVVTAIDHTTAANGGQTATGSGSPITITGLTNGNRYAFTVKAINAVGTGPASVPSPNVLPATVPGAPTVAGVTPGNAKAVVSFTVPASNGSPIVSYTVTATDNTNPANGFQTATGSGHTLTVTGLTNGDSYTFTVTATNGIGTGPASSPSNPVTPATVPGPPTAVTATAGDGQATVSFTAPAADGGSPITGYIVTAIDHTTAANGGQTATGSGSPITITGLTNGDLYAFTVKAINAVGTGPASVPSHNITP